MDHHPNQWPFSSYRLLLALVLSMEMTLQRQQPHPFLKIRVSSSSVSFYEQLSFTDLLQCSFLTFFATLLLL
jgi:hypothetical protein